MKVLSQTQLMKNHRHANVLSPDKSFDVIQTPTGDSLFFSIGTDHVFYVTQEVRSSKTGWNRIDLSTPLSKQLAGSKAVAKTFALSQNAKTGHFDVALVVTAQGRDTLFVSQGHTNEPSDWSKSISWTKMNFDAQGVTEPDPLTIADVYLMNIPDDGDQIQNCFVDILRKPGDSQAILDRYYINFDTPTKWRRQGLNVDLKDGSIQSCLGKRPNDQVPGIYTYGLINNTTELTYTPQYNFLRPDSKPNTARLTLPKDASVIDSCPTVEGSTLLFLAGDGGLFVYGPEVQYDLAAATLIVPPKKIGTFDLFKNIAAITALTAKEKTVVWLRNSQGMMFYVSCDVGSELDPGSWSSPIPLYPHVEEFAFYLNRHDGGTVLFAQVSGNELFQFCRNPDDGQWTSRPIYLPSTDIDDFVEFTSFTTNFTVTNDVGAPTPSAKVNLTSKVPCQVYVNNMYTVLTPNTPFASKSDANGLITVLQKTDNLSGTPITASLDGNQSDTHTIDPSAAYSDKIASVKSGSDLQNVDITSADGKAKKLVPSSVSGDDADAAARALTQLIEIKKDIHPQASISTITGAAPSAMQGAAPHDVVITGKPPSSIGDSILQAFGDLFAFVKHAWQSFETVFFRWAGDAWHFIAKIGEEIYHAIVDSIEKVVDAVVFVFNKIKVAFEDLIHWLGVIFNWPNIIRTHKVIKNELKAQGEAAIGLIDSIETTVKIGFDQLEDQINNWAKISDPEKTIGALQKDQNSSPSGQKPDANWALYHTKNNIDGTKKKDEEDKSDDTPGTTETVLKALSEIATEDAAHVQAAVQQVRKDIVSQMNSLSATDVVKKIIAIVGDLVLKSFSTVAVQLLEVAKTILKGLLDGLDEVIQIPIITPLYKAIVGSDLSILDLACLIAAFPANVAYAVAYGKAPFPDEKAMNDAIAAADSARKTSRDDFDSAVLTITKKGSTKAPEQTSSSTIHHTLYVIFQLAGQPGAMLKGFCTATKWAFEEAEAEGPEVLDNLSCVGDILCLAPYYYAWERADAWARYAKGAAMTAIVLNSLLGLKYGDNKYYAKAAPWCDLFFHAGLMCSDYAGFVTTITASKAAPRAHEVTMLAAHVCNDTFGILGPIDSKDPDMLLAREIVLVAFGLLSEVSGVAYALDVGK